MKFDLAICGTQHMQIACEVAYEAHKIPSHYSFEQYEDGATALFVYWRCPGPHAIPLPYQMTDPAHLALFIEGWANRGMWHGDNDYGIHVPTVRGYRMSNTPSYNYEDSGFTQSDIFIAVEPEHIKLS